MLLIVMICLAHKIPDTLIHQVVIGKHRHHRESLHALEGCQLIAPLFSLSFCHVDS